MHDPRIGRFFACDPLAPDYPWNSPYAFSENDVISCVELEGLEKIGAVAAAAAKSLGQKAVRASKIAALNTDVLTTVQNNVTALNVNMKNAPGSFKGEATRVVGGRKWNARWFWSEAANSNPEWFSAKNLELIKNGDLPVLDETYFKGLAQGLSEADVKLLTDAAPLGSALEHHHMNHGDFAVGLPRQVHRGAGNYKFWHKSGFRNLMQGSMAKVAKNGVKAIFILGTALSLMSAMEDGDASGGFLPTVDYDKDWISQLERGISSDNMGKAYIGLKMLKDNKDFTVMYMTADDLIRFSETGAYGSSDNGNFPKYQSIETMKNAGSTIYPYMMIKYKNEFVGIITVPDKSPSTE